MFLQNLPFWVRWILLSLFPSLFKVAMPGPFIIYVVGDPWEPGDMFNVCILTIICWLQHLVENISFWWSV